MHKSFFPHEKVLSGYQLGPQGTSTLRTRTEMLFETLISSLLNHLTWLIARENFIILSHWESNKSHSFLMLGWLWVGNV